MMEAKIRKGKRGKVFFSAHCQSTRIAGIAEQCVCWVRCLRDQLVTFVVIPRLDKADAGSRGITITRSDDTISFWSILIIHHNPVLSLQA